MDHNYLMTGWPFVVKKNRHPVLSRNNPVVGEVAQRRANRPWTVSPVNRLPSELLNIIFTLTALFGTGSDHWNFIHVCRYWRASALESARLWTTIPHAPPDLILGMLEWSRDLPINVSIESRTSARVLMRVIRCMHRVVALTVRPTDDSEVSPLLIEVLCSAAPQLEFANIQRLLGADRLWASGLFGGQAPRLEKLNTMGWIIKTSRSLVLNPSLRHLTLTYSTCFGNRPDRLDLSNLLGVLSYLPHLEELGLKDGTPERIFFAIPKVDEHSVKLPKLRVLSVASSIDFIECLFYALCFPPSTRVALRVRDTYRPPLVRGILHAYARKAPWINTGSELICLEEDDPRFVARDCDGNQMFSLILSFPMWLFLLSDDLLRLIGQPAVNSIKILRFMDELPGYAWEGILRCMPALRVVCAPIEVAESLLGELLCRNYAHDIQRLDVHVSKRVVRIVSVEDMLHLLAEVQKLNKPIRTIRLQKTLCTPELQPYLVDELERMNDDDLAMIKQ